jgi:hypothetical protein
MPQYCDSEKLEHNWFLWLLSSRVPDLEKYRKLGLLWTKVTGVSVDQDGNPITRRGQCLPDPSHPARTHCIALANPIYLNSYDGVLPETGNVYVNGRPVRQQLPTDEDLTLLSSSPLHLFDHPFQQQTVVIPNLVKRGYIQEFPTTQTWHMMIEDINKICAGIATRFKPRTEEEHQELTNDALLQVIRKLAAYKLVYKPGLAPVFNLFTTTIHRILYSVMNKRKTHKEGMSRVLTAAEAGVLPDSYRSLRVHTHKIRFHSR